MLVVGRDEADVPTAKGVDMPAEHGGDGFGVLAPRVAVSLCASDHAATWYTAFDGIGQRMPALSMASRAAPE
jgi:hypothetical protein